MGFKLYEEENIRAIANKIREKTGGSTKYTTESMPAGIDAVYNAGRAAGGGTGGSGGGSGKDVVLIARRITGNGSYSAADDGADGYSRVDVNVPASGSAELPALNSPTLALDNYTATLTIADPDNGSYPEEYLIYYGTEYIGSSAEKTVNLLSMTDFKANDYVEVIAAAPKFIDSPVAAVEWVKPELNSPTFEVNSITGILTVTAYDIDKTDHFDIYVDGGFILTMSDTEVNLNDYISGHTSTQVVAMIAVAKDSYYGDSSPATIKWYSNLVGTDGLAYSTYGDYAICTGIGAATETDIIIGAYYNGIPVTTVRVGAFEGNGDITSVYISEGITHINSNAFRRCSNMRSVTLPSTLTTISDNAFAYCTSLVSPIYIPESVTNMGTQCFVGCESLPGAIIAANITKIPMSTFGLCLAMTWLAFHNGITSVDRGTTPDLTDVYYEGTEMEFTSIHFESDSDASDVYSATIHYIDDITAFVPPETT